MAESNQEDAFVAVLRAVLKSALQSAPYPSKMKLTSLAEVINRGWVAKRKGEAPLDRVDLDLTDLGCRVLRQAGQGELLDSEWQVLCAHAKGPSEGISLDSPPMQKMKVETEGAPLPFSRHYFREPLSDCFVKTPPACSISATSNLLHDLSLAIKTLKEKKPSLSADDLARAIQGSFMEAAASCEATIVEGVQKMVDKESVQILKDASEASMRIPGPTTGSYPLKSVTFNGITIKGPPGFTPGQMESMATGASRPQNAEAGNRPVDIITFIESKWGLDHPPLFLVQRVILKAFYGLALDTKTPNVQVRDFYKGTHETLTEAQYLEKLFCEGRCNIRTVVPGQENRELVLPIGRRGGKGFLNSCIAAYETYKLILKECPQEHYGLTENHTISITAVACDKEEAEFLHNEIRGHAAHSPFLRQYLAGGIVRSDIRFQTPRDVKTHGHGSPAKETLRVAVRSPCSAGLRGSANILVILDDLAHFEDAKNVYYATKPSLAVFSPKDANGRPTGPVEGRMVSVSTPRGREGHFYRLFQLAFSDTDALKNNGMLAIQVPAWEINPTLPFEFLETQRAIDPVAFDMEYGAQFLPVDALEQLEKKQSVASIKERDVSKWPGGQLRTPEHLAKLFPLDGMVTAADLKETKDIGKACPHQIINLDWDEE